MASAAAGVEAAHLGRVDRGRGRPAPGRSSALGADRAHLDDVGDDLDAELGAAAALASVPAATRAAVSRAEARSSTSRASAKPYFCMPARSAWPGRGWVSGACGRTVLGPTATSPCCHLSGLRFHSVLAISMATGEPSVRPWRTPPTRVTSSCSKRMRGPAAVAEAAPGQLGLDVLDGHRQAGGQALDDDHEGRAVRLAGGEEAEHLANLPGDRIPPDRLVGAPRSGMRSWARQDGRGFSPG